MLPVMTVKVFESDELPNKSYLARVETTTDDGYTVENGSLGALLHDIQKKIFLRERRLADPTLGTEWIHCTGDCVRSIVTDGLYHRSAKKAGWRTWRCVEGLHPGEAVCPLHRASNEPLRSEVR